MLRIKKNDLVQVMVGRDKGKQGKVLRVLTKENKVLVEGVNAVTRNQKPSHQNPEGGRVTKNLPVHISNVAFVDAESKKPAKVSIAILENGKKERKVKKHIGA